METQQTVIDAVLDERGNQDAKWGRAFDGRPDERWLTILTEEVGEIAEAILRGDDADVVKEIVQAAAVCVSWLEFRTVRARQMESESPAARSSAS